MAEEKSTNEVIVKSGKTADVGGGKTWEIRDAEARMVFVDYFTENRVNNGTVCISLGALHTDGANDPVIEVSTRLRMDLGFAQTLHHVLGELISGALKPVDKSATN